MSACSGVHTRSPSQLGSFDINLQLSSARAALDKNIWVIALSRCIALALSGLAQRKKETRWR